MVKKLKKQFDTPNEGWNEERINREDQLSEEYGLTKKKEVYKAQSQLRDFRRQARKLAASHDEEQTEAFLGRVNRLGMIREDDGLETVLSLDVEDVLDRRLQTAVSRRGHAETPLDARQMIVHGHVYVEGQRVTVPSYMLTQEEEKSVEVVEPEPDEEPPEEQVEEDEGEQQTGEDESEQENDNE
jgi:small subunit ribosomal protein S4